MKSKMLDCLNRANNLTSPNNNHNKKVTFGNINIKIIINILYR
jgi:hypothetical protein